MVDAAARGRSGVIVLRGEAGIGKTRLAREAAARCKQAGFEIFVGVADEMEQRRPFGLLGDALRVEGALDRRRTEIREVLRGGGEGAGAFADTAMLEARVVGLALSYVEELSERRSVALVLEDLHWADPSSLLAIHRLAHVAAGRRPVLLVCTLRPYPERRELRMLLASLDRIGAARLALEPIDGEAVRVLAEAVSGAPPGASLLRRLETAGGNPLFLTELLGALAAEGGLRIGADGSAEAVAGRLPSSLQLTILSRLSSLPEPTLQLLRTASLLGSRFAVAELVLASETPAVRVAEALGPAMRAGALVEAGEHLAFRHDVIREAVYEDMPLAVRRALHRELATRLATAGAPSEQVAAHMLRGADPGDAEAIRWLRRAAHDVEERAPAIAVELLEAALALTPDGASEQEAIRAALITPLNWSGRGADTAALCAQALAEHPGGEHEGFFRLGLARGLFAQGRLLDARSEFEQLLHSSALADETRVLVRAYRAYVGAFLHEDGALDDAEALLRAAPTGPLAAIALLTLAAGAVLDGRDDRALEYIARAGAEEWQPGRQMRAVALLGLDRPAEARETLRAGVRAAEAAGAGGLGAGALYRAWLAVVEYQSGRLDPAAAEHVAARELGVETRQQWLAGGHGLPALIAVHRGRLDEAERALATAAAEEAEVGPQPFVALAYVARARLAEARGRPEAAAAAAADALQVARRYEPPSHSAWLAPHIARIALAAGARELAEAATATADRAVNVLDVGSRRGCALLARGLLADDVELLLDAVDLLRAAPHPLELALALESAAALLAGAGRNAEAGALAAEAIELYRESGAAADEARARLRLRAAGLRVGVRGRRGRPSFGWESLTEAELRVVGLVAEGQSNPQIAERLYLTRRTVRAHVSSALRKLELSSRAELAAEVARRGL